MRRRPRLFVALVAVLVGAGACSAPTADSTMGEPSSTTEHTPPVSTPDAAMSSATPSTAGPSASAAGLPDDPLLAMALTDVRTGDEFTLAELVADGPVIVETMAIWCANCRTQMHEVTAAHELADFHSVSIDVEPSEAAADLAAYAEREGYDWPFALADAELATELRNRFGTEVLFPPGMPKLLIGADGEIELLPLGELLSAADIAALVEG